MKPSQTVPGYQGTETVLGGKLREDVVAAVRQEFPPGEAKTAMEALGRIQEHDRLVVAALVAATMTGLAREARVKALVEEVELCFVDYRDVLMVEYHDSAAYKEELARLGLERPYPV